MREALAFPHTRDGRAAIIHWMHNRRPLMISASDLAIISSCGAKVLLIGKNEHHGLLSFPGGHAEKNDGNGWQVAVREGSEEIRGITHSTPSYLETLVVDDPRYRGTDDGIMTTFYRAAHESGEPAPGDDADSIHWVARGDLSERLVPWHKPLGDILLAHWPQD